MLKSSLSSDVKLSVATLLRLTGRDATAFNVESP